MRLLLGVFLLSCVARAGTIDGITYNWTLVGINGQSVAYTASFSAPVSAYTLDISLPAWATDVTFFIAPHGQITGSSQFPPGAPITYTAAASVSAPQAFSLMSVEIDSKPGQGPPLPNSLVFTSLTDPASPAPEAATWALSSGGLFVLVLCRRWRLRESRWRNTQA